ncbi:MAG: hypothetical protein ACT4PO_02150 [Actinomycetota bacterium]
MDKCSACGGRISPGLTWCGRCYTPVLRVIVGPALPDRAGPRRRPEIEPPPEPVYSHWRGGPTTLGPLAKLAITIGLLGLGLACYPLASGWAESLGEPSLGFVAFFVWGYFAVAALLLTQLWKRGRIR